MVSPILYVVAFHTRTRVGETHPSVCHPKGLPMGHTTGYLLKHVESARVKSSFAENFSSRSLPLPRVVCVEEEISFFVALDRRWRFLLVSFLSGERIEQVLRDGKLLEESISQEKSFGEVRIELARVGQGAGKGRAWR